MFRGLARTDVAQCCVQLTWREMWEGTGCVPVHARHAWLGGRRSIHCSKGFCKLLRCRAVRRNMLACRRPTQRGHAGHARSSILVVAQRRCEMSSVRGSVKHNASQLHSRGQLVSKGSLVRGDLTRPTQAQFVAPLRRPSTPRAMDHHLGEHRSVIGPHIDVVASRRVANGQPGTN